MRSTTDDSMCCANCGKGEEENTSLKACTACKMVKYCNRDCQIAHRPQHKKACKKRAAELHDEKLFKEPPSPEDCPICCLPMPIDLERSIFKPCCGKLICDGCSFAVMDGDFEKGKKKEEVGLCPFCRTPSTCSNEEVVKRLKKLMERGNAEAHNQLGGYYSAGLVGLTQDHAKANELFLKAGELGCAASYHNLALAYDSGWGVDIDEKKAKYFYELAAMNGYLDARHNLGVTEEQAGNGPRAYKHYMIAAKCGHKKALDYVKDGFKDGLVTKDEYAQVLRDYHERQLEMKSEARDNAVEFRERLAALRRG